MPSLTLESQINRTVGQCRVYLKDNWGGAWVQYERVYATELTWSLAPSMPVATLMHFYGYVKDEWSTQYIARSKLDVNGWYVKVECDYNTDPVDTVSWHGIVCQVEDTHEGLVTVDSLPRATGTQVLHCYGLEKLLDTEHIHESAVDVGDPAVIWSALPVTFNRDNFPNRAELSRFPGMTPVFDGTSHGFGGNTRHWWSTTTIVRYLLAWGTPKTNFAQHLTRIPYELYDWHGLLPSTDHPVLDQEGQTVLSLLHRLIDRRRLRSFYLSVDDTTTPHTIRLEPVAWNVTDIFTPTITDFEKIKGAHPLMHLTVNFDSSQSTSVVVRASEVAKYDRVIVRGARRTSTMTFAVDATHGLLPAWTASQESDYEAGASGAAGYAALDMLTQMQRNAEVRAKPTLQSVYSWFYLPDSWSRLAEDPVSLSVHFAFVDDDGFEAFQNIQEVVFEPWLPLWEQEDYETVTVIDDPAVRTWRAPYLVFESPLDERWVSADAIALLAESSSDQSEVDDGDNYRWSATIRPQRDNKIVEINASGEPQHVIAHTDFTPLAVDRDLGNFDYRDKKMLATLTLRDNRFTEGVYPTDPYANTGLLVDEVYALVINAGEEYRRDYIVLGTVVDVDEEGDLVQSGGGYARDDTDTLSALAYIAYDWWHTTRMTLTLQTLDCNSFLSPGYIITTIGDSAVALNEHYQEVNTLITEARISWPTLSEGQREAPMLTIITSAAELDVMSILPPRVRDKKPKRR